MPAAGLSRNPWFWTVLTLLHERPMHPYEIAQLTRERGKDLFAAHKPGSLYSVIDRLHADGLIDTVEVSREGRRPERTVYSLTGEGHTELLRWLHAELGELDECDLPRFAFAVEKLAHLDPTVAAGLLRDRSRAVAAQLTHLDRISEDAPTRGVTGVSLLEIDYARALRSTELAWLERTSEDIEAGRLTWTTAGDTASTDSDDEEKQRR